MLDFQEKTDLFSQKTLRIPKKKLLLLLSIINVQRRAFFVPFGGLSFFVLNVSILFPFGFRRVFCRFPSMIFRVSQQLFLKAAEFSLKSYVVFG